MSTRKLTIVTALGLSGLLVLTGCRDQPVDSPTGTPTPVVSEEPTGLDTDRIQQGIEQILGEDAQITFAQEAAENINEIFLPADPGDRVALEYSDACTIDIHPDELVESGTVVGTLASTDQADHANTEQLGLLEFLDVQAAEGFMAEVDDYAKHCDTLTVESAEDGYAVSRKVELVELQHHTDQAIALQFSDSARTVQTQSADQNQDDENHDDENQNTGDDLHQTSTSVSFVREGHIVVVSLQSPENQVSLLLTRIDELLEFTA